MTHQGVVRLLVGAHVDRGASRRVHNPRRVRVLAVTVAALAVAAGVGPGRGATGALAPTAQAAESGSWLAAWAPAPEWMTGDAWATTTFPGGEASDQSIRTIASLTAPGDALRLRVTNRYGTTPMRIGALRVALREAGPEIRAGTSRVVTFSGRPAIVVPPGFDLTSDPIPFSAWSGAEVAVSAYVAGTMRSFTWHPYGSALSYVAAPGSGDTTADEEGTSYRAAAVSVFWLAGIDEHSSSHGTVVAFGDSLTDGYPVVPDQHEAWPDVLAVRMASAPEPQRLAVVNAGLSRNQLVQDCDVCGPAGRTRVAHDALDLAGVKTIILFEGTNDLGWRTLPGRISAALAEVVDQARALHIRVIGATITPRSDSGWQAYDEQARNAVNFWIRHSGVFDAVADFDVVVRDPSNPSRLRPEYDAGDHLHLNPVGLQALADSVDLAQLS